MNQMTMNKKSLLPRLVLRLAVGLVAFGALGGPSPGFIGGCGSNAPPDAGVFCNDSRYRECYREYQGGRIDDAAFNTCYDGVPAYCSTRQNWRDCVPTNGAVNACLAALEDASRFPTPSDMIVECTNLCPAGI